MGLYSFRATRTKPLDGRGTSFPMTGEMTGRIGADGQGEGFDFSYRDKKHRTSYVFLGHC